MVILLVTNRILGTVVEQGRDRNAWLLRVNMANKIIIRLSSLHTKLTGLFPSPSPQQQREVASSNADRSSFGSFSPSVSPTSPQLCPTTPTTHQHSSAMPLSPSALGSYLSFFPESFFSSFDDMCSARQRAIHTTVEAKLLRAAHVALSPMAVGTHCRRFIFIHFFNGFYLMLGHGWLVRFVSLGCWLSF